MTAVFGCHFFKGTLSRVKFVVFAKQGTTELVRSAIKINHFKI
jgi:hypothetical protein